jgi:hypothetical protein
MAQCPRAPVARQFRQASASAGPLHKGHLAAASGPFSRQRRLPCVADIVDRYVVVCDGSHPALDCLPGHSVARYVGARTPQPHSALLGFFAQPLEVAAVGVGEGGCAGEAQDDEVLVEGVLVRAVFVWVEIDVGEGASVGVF